MVAARWRSWRGWVGWLGSCFDPRSRRPLVLLFAASMVVFLGPLAWDLAGLLLEAIPRRVRWCAGQSAMVAAIAIGIGRLWRIRPGDAWPSTIPDDPAAPGSPAAARWIPWALRLAVASLLIPILRHPDGLGFADWDFVLDKYEAIRRTIVIWGQFPWWDPWCRGGFPLAAEPQIGVVSIATPLILWAGTGIGLRIAAVIFIGIAVEGAYRLAHLWLREPWGSAAAAMVYALNGAVLVHTADGYIIVMSYASLPWLAYHAFRIREGLWQGVALGFWAAFSVLHGLQYLTIYAAPMTAAIWLRALRLEPAGGRVALIRPTLAAAGTFLLLAGWRSATMIRLLLEDQRERVTSWNESLSSIPRYLIERPIADWPEVIPGPGWSDYCALTSYVGISVVALAAYSLARGWRWWHTLVVLTGWLAIGSVQWYHPSAWLADWPFIGSAHVVTRWRFVAMLGLGLAAGSVIARWRASGIRLRAALAAAATLAIAADYLAIAFDQLPLTFSVRPEPSLFPNPPVTEIVNVRDGLGYACALRGYGVIEGYEPMLSYQRNAPTLRQGRGDPGYRGEAWTVEGEIRPVSWSPNRIVFRVRPGQEVFINQNPGSWWRVNGVRLFQGRRCAEPTLPFAARADDNGRLELRIDPPGWPTGIVLHALGAGLLTAAWLGRGRRPGVLA